ncbi:MAG: UTP--glucose-1-phosphate uridylyltransferase GalU [Tissierellia bacterium]|nr:UTP--glucose-1-phosphate uridylyltransferase GalU [Tissierellia bacterium]
MRVKKAIIPAAGLGTRFLPATKAQPKEMLPILDVPTLQIIVEEAVNSGITDILIITGRNKHSIENHFDRNIELEMVLENNKKFELLDEIKKSSNLANIYYFRQSIPLGLGNAIGCGRSFVGNEPFAVLLGDDIVYSDKPATKQLIDAFEKHNSSILGVQKVPIEDINKYGSIDGDFLENRTYKVKSTVEKPNPEDAPSNVAILGRYIITPKIFDILDKQKPGVGGEIQLTDALNTLADLEDVYAYEFEGDRYDVGSKLGFLKATIRAGLLKEDIREEFIEHLKDIVENEK